MGGKALGGKEITNENAHNLFEKLFLENNLGCKASKYCCADQHVAERKHAVI